MNAGLIYPHQLFRDHPALRPDCVPILVEDPLFFTQYRFHAQKLVLHRATMREFADELRSAGWSPRLVSAGELAQSGEIGEWLRGRGYRAAALVDPGDDWLLTRVRRSVLALGLELQVLEDPHFLTPPAEFEDFAGCQPKLSFTEFYIRQRRRLGILLGSDGRPVGGQWSFDVQNRRKLPAGLTIPRLEVPPRRPSVADAIESVGRDFPDAPGCVSTFAWQVTRSAARSALEVFLRERLAQFGDYEDAMRTDETFLFHSVLTPSLNTGLLCPAEIVQGVAEEGRAAPLNAREGFLRQVIGWREYMRGVYRVWGRRQRTTNFFGHTHPMPAACYAAQTGIDPVDTVIQRVLRHAYCHHIERLMVLGNFFLLCEIHPDAIYQWFMELFIDAYDWVMVPNVYGMSQYADGGLITTKPYLSGSAYIRKMSDFPKGDWCPIWDGLYWRFIWKHRRLFASNPRMAMIVSQCNRLGEKLQVHLRNAEQFLERLHGNVQ